jgi:hypothetical protein
MKAWKREVFSLAVLLVPMIAIAAAEHLPRARAQSAGLSKPHEAGNGRSPAGRRTSISSENAALVSSGSGFKTLSVGSGFETFYSESAISHNGTTGSDSQLVGYAA